MQLKSSLSTFFYITLIILIWKAIRAFRFPVFYMSKYLVRIFKPCHFVSKQTGTKELFGLQQMEETLKQWQSVQSSFVQSTFPYAIITPLYRNSKMKLRLARFAFSLAIYFLMEDFMRKSHKAYN